MLRSILCRGLSLYSYILFARVILSLLAAFKPGWQPPAWSRPIVDAIYSLTEPPLRALRKVIPQPAGMPLDLSFLVLYLSISILRRIIEC